ncbi:peptidoglycan DD-metalloendopeptidase family protein [Marinomonas sp. C2222]|uniref:Peptidoglycan DD-metalloendopeptidase family protein n=1 Tax=Marinomonas sargassi TaxID=2984494 RepID=A0ABT2YTW2_9GAMM|nr:peptidoglycan DD-metalloendopeptidase family protein [Marinomonas sargassi]MCV2403332.1 peptidoglycan DD-metalloendopeptidase family protein [Marinomonas sargassi]
MQLIKKRLSRQYTSTVIWLVVYACTFGVLLLTYKAMVPSAQPFKSDLLPSVAEATLNEGEVDSSALPPSSLTADTPSEESLLKQVQISPIERPLMEYSIKSGDSLERIFKRLGLSLSSLYAVLEADQEFLVLEPLKIKDEFTFQLDVHGELMVLTRHVNPSKSISYVRHAAGGFYYEENIKPISYRMNVLHGAVEGSFYASLKRLDLSSVNIATLREILAQKVNVDEISKEGGEIDLVTTQGHINGVEVGGAQLDAIQIRTSYNGEVFSAFLHSDGRFYDVDGMSLTPSLRRWPTSQEYRVSSPFNDKRLHPITSRISPHNGVDLATPTGTQVLATGDGVVTRVERHRYAGQFIEVDYAGPYGARFLHLNKTLVKKGQKVSRGQVIALSGNTGRSTGPHLHYELHIKGSPVNPMTADIPNTFSIPTESKAEFDRNVTQSLRMMANKEIAYYQ